MDRKRFFGKGLPKTSASKLKGALVVIEGADGSGRSTQIQMLRNWLENLGYPTAEVGLKRSRLTGKELQEAMKSPVLCPTTLSLFYATDLADQLENVIIPSLRAGFVVIADRYVYSLMARAIVRGAPHEWIKDVYGFALVPDITFYLKVPPASLAARNFFKLGSLDYWESGQDISRQGDVYECFIKYQTKIQKVFNGFEKLQNLIAINGEAHPQMVQKALQRRLITFLEKQMGRRKSITSAR